MVRNKVLVMTYTCFGGKERVKLHGISRSIVCLSVTEYCSTVEFVAELTIIGGGVLLCPIDINFDHGFLKVSL